MRHFLILKTDAGPIRQRPAQALYLVLALALVLALLLAGTGPAGAQTNEAERPLPAMTVYKSPTCGCCGAWIDHLRAAGFQVNAEDRDDMGAIKARYGVPRDLTSCHTGVIDGYVIEGHVPAADIRRLLAERPEADGLAVPGMPVGSPGMEIGDRSEPYQSVLFSGEQRRVFARHGEAAD